MAIHLPNSDILEYIVSFVNNTPLIVSWDIKRLKICCTVLPNTVIVQDCIVLLSTVCSVLQLFNKEKYYEIEHVSHNVFCDKNATPLNRHN